MNETNLALMYKGMGFNDAQVKKIVMDSAKGFIANTDFFENDNAEYFSQILFGNLQRALVFCLSKNYKNTLMWSHYASKHTGICIGFNQSKLLTSLNLYHAGVVDYSGKPYDVICGLGEDELHPAKSICFMKSPDWSYEEEFRLLHAKLAKTDSESIGFKYTPDSIETIYFGLSSTEEQRNEVMNRLKGKGYKYYIMGTHPRHLSYDLEVASEVFEHI